MTVDANLLQLPDRPRLRLTMLSDWHVGSGTGRPGHVDRLVVRDAEGLPYLPAKTLTGIWRDACERLTLGLDGGRAGAWCEWVKYLFGDQPSRRGETDPSAAPRPALVSVRAGHLANALRVHLAGTDVRAQTLRAALTFIKPGVAIDTRSGRALDEHLRFEEMARTGAVLTAEFSVAWPAEPTARAAVAALLIASTPLVERVGGKRRRGSGRCRMEIDQADLNAALAWLEGHEQAPELPQKPKPGFVPAPCIVAVENSSQWRTIPFVLELSAPVAVSSRTVGNVIESLDFVPGTYLLPHVTAALTRMGLDARAAIARGDVRVLPATIDIEGHAGRAVPLALFQPKEGGSLASPKTLVNRLLMNDDSPAQLKQCRSGYLGEGTPGTMPLFATAAMTLRTHNTVDEESQRPTREVGGVYSYEAIAVPRLRGELRLRKALCDQVTGHSDWRKLLEGPCRLGRSKKDDYGSVTLKIAEHEPSREVPPAALGRPDRLVVWLLSDVLLRDERLRPAPSAASLADELGRKLGVSLTVKTPFVRVRRTESWHVGWGLPRPSLLALQAGSCIEFSVHGTLAAEVLSQVEAEGVGERTAEGYGHIRFNDALLLTPPDALQAPASPVAPLHPQPTPLAAADPAYPWARRVEEEVWRDAIRRAALTGAQERRGEWLGWQVAHNQPPLSQLGSLRNVVQQVRTWADRTLVIGWLDHLQQTKRRAEKWPGDALPRLRRLFESPAAIWQLLDPATWPTLTKHAAEELELALWPLAVRSLIDACIRAHTRELDRMEGRST